MDTAAEKLLRTVLTEDYDIENPDRLLVSLATELKHRLGIEGTLTEEDVRNVPDADFEDAVDFAMWYSRDN